MDKILLFLFFLLIHFNCFSQVAPLDKISRKTVNWGVRAGVNALTPSSYDIYYNGTKLDGSIRNQVSYQAAATIRVNFYSVFIQPEFSFYSLEEEINFSIPQAQKPDLLTKKLDVQSYSCNFPVLIGYSYIKEGPYLLNVFAGPSFSYNFKDKYNIEGETKFEDQKIKPEIKDIIKPNLVLGMSANISNLYFDFRYEFNFMDRDIDFSGIEGSPAYLKDMKIDKKENILSFSCGFLF